MRRLLERPDLEQLRHQAREPQRASGDPIRLGETQLRLAREYGFPSWTALKSEVLRRRGSPSAVDYRIRSVATREELVTAYDLMGAQFEPPVTHFPSRVRKPRRSARQ